MYRERFMKEVDFYIDGMSCSACSSGIERALGRKDFCQKIEVNLLTNKAHLIYDESKANLEQIFAFITKLGYTPSLEILEKSLATKPRANNFLTKALVRLYEFESKFLSAKSRLFLSIAFSIPVIMFSVAFMFDFHVFAPKIESLFSLIATLIVMHLGRMFYFKGFKALYRLYPTMDSLIALGTSAAFMYSLKGVWDTFMLNTHVHLYFESVCVILCFVMIGKAIETTFKENAKKSANVLLKLYQKKVHKRIDSKWCEVALSEVAVNDEIKILPGDIVPLDGVVIDGISSIDTSSINGENIPVLKRAEDFIESGSINLESVLILRVQKTGSQTLLSQIITLIQNADNSKAPLGMLADKVAGVFVPVMIAIALLAGIFWWIVRDFSMGVDIFVSVLVISCPCALGLATPMAFLNARGVANKMGVFFKTSASLQALSKITHIVFDKTGTLSDGLKISHIKVAQSLQEKEFLAIVLALEQNSGHVISKAIQSFIKANAPELFAQPLKVSDFQSLIGFGIKGQINAKSYILGNLQALEELNLTDSQLKEYSQIDSKLIVYLADDKQILGALYLQDLLRKDCEMMIAGFCKHNIATAMLSGDIAQNAEVIAKTLGINEVFAGAKPADKLNIINQYKATGVVAMVGDGVNDAAALKAADVSMAYASGNDIAQNCADIILYNQNAKAILNAYRLACLSIKNVKQNLYWAFGYNVAFIPVACGILGGFGIFLNPMFCAFAMSLSSISVVFNAMRIQRFKTI